MDISGRDIHAHDQYETWQREIIRTYGWAVQAVIAEEDDPSFAYTVGLTGFRHPELIIFAQSQLTSGTVLNELGELVRAGRQLGAGETVEIPSGSVHLLSFPNPDEWLIRAQMLYAHPSQRKVTALLVIPGDDLVVREPHT